jgi:hypothetical protein
MTRSSLVLVLKTGLVVALTAAPALGAARDHLPLRFEAQEGEVARFVARTASHTVVIAPNRVELHPPGAREPLRLFFVGARSEGGLRGEIGAGLSNHYRGKDPRQWRVAVPN